MWRTWYGFFSWSFVIGRLVGEVFGRSAGRGMWELVGGGTALHTRLTRKSCQLSDSTALRTAITPLLHPHSLRATAPTLPSALLLFYDTTCSARAQCLDIHMMPQPDVMSFIRDMFAASWNLPPLLPALLVFASVTLSYFLSFFFPCFLPGAHESSFYRAHSQLSCASCTNALFTPSYSSHGGSHMPSVRAGLHFPPLHM